MKLHVDEDVAAAVAESLRRRRIDVVATHEAGNAHASDAAPLKFAADAGRCLVTRDVRDFVSLAIGGHQEQDTT
ncbi:MAG: DUF5615 family PIN-like protein [Candidatus Riflebacteria bacterium]|nr:DUF5615 family PIN-like protein [Candidatus Riflebacteria bacterium]